MNSLFIKKQAWLFLPLLTLVPLAPALPAGSNYPASVRPVISAPLASIVDDPCWSPFTNLSDAVSVSFCRTMKRYDNKGNSMWTWKFRNDGSNTITYLEYEYTEYHADGVQEKHKDYFPGTLAGGKVFGGWAAFSAIGTREPTLRIIKIERK